MRIRIGVESNFDGHSIAWALDFPGCAAHGADNSEAILRLPQRLVFYANRVAARVENPWWQVGDFDLRMVEAFEGYSINEDYETVASGSPGSYEVNAFFRDDWRPLQEQEVQQGLAMLGWNRADLLNLVSGLDDSVLDQPIPGERWSVRGILRHLGGAEWWYLDRLGLGQARREELPADALARLAFSRERLESVLPELAGRADMVRGKDGEFWSPRKLLRRAIWHEMDHIEHIIRLITA